jgi:hypothetical protein
VGLEDSSWTTNLEGMAVILGCSQEEWVQSSMYGVLISPDFSYITFTTSGDFTGEWAQPLPTFVHL